MAEFQIVAKEIERLCKTYQDKCRTDECPLYLKDLCYAQAMSYIHEYKASELEDAVMRWSEEHPVVYPTWGEFLYNLYPMMGPSTITDILEFHVPSDLAEKLGIEPKEG